MAKKKKILKLGEIHGSKLVGVFTRKTKSKYSPIFWLTMTDGSEVGVFGNKSLNPYMVDELIGLPIQIECPYVIEVEPGKTRWIADVQLVGPEGLIRFAEMVVDDPFIPKPMYLLGQEFSDRP